MALYQAEVTQLRFNAATQKFEALVIFHEGHDHVSYPCELEAPISSEFALISRALVVQAKVKRARDAHGLMSRLKTQLPAFRQVRTAA